MKKKILLEEYQKAMNEMHEKNKGFGSVNRHMFLLSTFIIFGILLFVFSHKSMIPSIGTWLYSKVSIIIIPYIILVAVFYLIVFIVMWIKSHRCPKCNKLFPKGKLKLHYSHMGTGVGINSGGDFYFRPRTTSAYWTECKYCGHTIWVTKGG
ncbi:hypothetical protein ACFL56_02715 [Candidatus Margulisiibacteriota bacterium]